MVGGFAPKKKSSRTWTFFLGLVDPSRNRLASMVYFARLFIVLHAWVGTYAYIKIIFFSERKIKLQIFPIFIFQVYFSDFYLHACKTLKPGFFWYAVDTNLFRLGSTNTKKNSQTIPKNIDANIYIICTNILYRRKNHVWGCRNKTTHMYTIIYTFLLQQTSIDAGTYETFKHLWMDGNTMEIHTYT